VDTHGKVEKEFLKTLILLRGDCLSEGRRKKPELCPVATIRFKRAPQWGTFCLEKRGLGNSYGKKRRSNTGRGVWKQSLRGEESQSEENEGSNLFKTLKPWRERSLWGGKTLFQGADLSGQGCSKAVGERRGPHLLNEGTVIL